MDKNCGTCFSNFNGKCLKYGPFGSELTELAAEYICDQWLSKEDGKEIAMEEAWNIISNKKRVVH